MNSQEDELELSQTQSKSFLRTTTMALSSCCCGFTDFGVGIEEEIQPVTAAAISPY